MADCAHICGIVLAGGRSSRMGKNKALLNYRGKPLFRHMVDILKETGIKDIYISGSVPGYTCFEDSQPHSGPALAIQDMIQRIPEYSGYLVVPVDMPRLCPSVLQQILLGEHGGYFVGRPLPVFLKAPIIMNGAQSVQEFIDAQNVSATHLNFEEESAMINVNTPEDWERALSP